MSFSASVWKVRWNGIPFSFIGLSEVKRRVCRTKQRKRRKMHIRLQLYASYICAPLHGGSAQQRASIVQPNVLYNCNYDPRSWNKSRKKSANAKLRMRATLMRSCDVSSDATSSQLQTRKTKKGRENLGAQRIVRAEKKREPERGY